MSARSTPIVNLCPSCAPAFRDVRTMFALASASTRCAVRAELIARCLVDHITWHPRGRPGSGWDIERDDDGMPVRLVWWQRPMVSPGRPRQWVSGEYVR